MKRIFLPALICFPAISQAAIISISGVIDGDAGLGPGEGDTIDYLRFEVLTASLVTLAGAPPRSGIEYILAEFIGLEDRFGSLSSTGPSRLPFDCIGFNCEDSPPNVLSRQLDPGEYIVVAGVRENTSYDEGDGFLAVNPEGGGFVRATYGFTVEGDIRGIDFREGNLDNTFTTTILVPEPSSALLAGLTFCAACLRRRR